MVIGGRISSGDVAGLVGGLLVAGPPRKAAERVYLPRLLAARSKDSRTIPGSEIVNAPGVEHQDR